MTKKVAVAACSNSCLDYVNHPYDIKMARSKLIFGSEEFEDFIEITAEKFYEKLKENPSIVPRTAQASPQNFLDIYEYYENKGFEELIIVTISSQLSGSYHGAISAANIYEGELKVHVYDSKAAGFYEGVLALEAAKLAEENMSSEDILKTLDKKRANCNIYFAVDTLKYLVKNGRLSNAAGIIGTALKIKPLLNLNNEGKIVSFEKIRTFRKAVERVLEQFFNEVKGKEFDVYLLNSDNDEMIEYMINRIQEAYPEIKDIQVVPLTPVIGAHTGPGVVSLGYFIK